MNREQAITEAFVSLTDTVADDDVPPSRFRAAWSNTAYA